MTLSVPDVLAARLCAGVEHQQAGRFSQAVAIYAEVLQASPEHPDALHLLGLAARTLDRPEEAVHLLRRAVAAAPEVALFHNSLGELLSALGDGPGALAAFERAVALDPDDAEARTNRDAARTSLRRHRLAVYQQGVENLRRSVYMDYPAHVHLETWAMCNASCDFCPFPRLQRRGERMPMDLIEKVISDLSDIPSSVPFQLSPFKVNEPFLDKRLFDVLRLCNERLPHAGLALTSNASPITEAALEKLAEVRNVNYLWVSVNDHRPQVYEQVMGLPFARTLERLRLLHRFKESGRLSTRVVLSRVGDGSAADQQFAGWVAENFPLFTANVFERGSWLGQVDTVVAQVPGVGCSRWFELSITATGVVAHCCMDGQAEWPIGNVREKHVLEIYNAPEYRRLRERTGTRLQATPCNRCTFF